MEGLIRQYPFIYFVFFWLAVTSFLGFLSGWYRLMNKYPDREDEVLFQANWQSGSMGRWVRVRMRGVLNISVCRSGLRIGIMRIFGIFCRDFFVPWVEIGVQRKNYFFGTIVELKFGSPAIGRLKIPAGLADRLARSALGHWPEPGPFPEETNEQLIARLTKLWLLGTSFGALFFIVVPRIAHDKHLMPIAIAIIFPAIVTGVACLIEYVRHTRG